MIVTMGAFKNNFRMVRHQHLHLFCQIVLTTDIGVRLSRQIVWNCCPNVRCLDTERSDQTWRKSKQGVTFIASHKPDAVFFSLLNR